MTLFLEKRWSQESAGADRPETALVSVIVLLMSLVIE
jgi:hypothetical protein